MELFEDQVKFGGQRFLCLQARLMRRSKKYFAGHGIILPVEIVLLLYSHPNPMFIRNKINQ
jgi:hypothetical protein